MTRKLLRFINKYCGTAIILGVFLPLKVRDIMFYVFKSKRGAGKTKLNNILIIKIVGLGDTVLMLPSIRKIITTYPDSKISVLVTPLSSGILAYNPMFSEVIVYDVLGKHKGILGFSKIILELRKRKFAAIIDYEQHIRLTTVLSCLTGADKIIGFDSPRAKRGYLLTDRICLDGKKHMIESFNDLLGPLGIAAEKVERLERITFSDGVAREDIERWLREQNISSEQFLVGIHIGSGGTATCRRWSKEGFAEIADRLIQRSSAKVVFTGNSEELPLINDVVKLMKNSCLIAAGHTSIKQLVALVARFNLFISNDTGPMHIGPAMGTPTIGLFGPNSPERYGPFGLQHIAVYKKVDCSPCINIHNGEVPDCKNPKCMKSITVDMVWQAIESQLNKIERYCQQQL